ISLYSFDSGGSGENTLKPSGFHEDDPFFYDEHTLRKRGLLVAAVLFITGIIILTSGKCRQEGGNRRRARNNL
uniref:FXYD domain-containing ion transport regulator n=1 Tax=Theropithecus gelada TaxID=9565 RepID=A0A8D2JX22_THEGE